MTEVRHWQDITPQEAADKELDLSKRMDISAPLTQEGIRCPWPWEPQQLVGVPMGQYHCSYCGEMVIAGVPHIDWANLPADAPSDAERRHHREQPPYDMGEEGEWALPGILEREPEEDGPR